MDEIRNVKWEEMEKSMPPIFAKMPFMKAFIKKQFESMQNNPEKFKQMQEKMMASAQGQQMMAQMATGAP